MKLKYLKIIYPRQFLKMLVLLLFFCGPVVLAATPSRAMLILDDMVFIGPKSSAAIFKVKNATTRPEAYRLGWVQLRLKPGGGKEKIAPGETVENVMPAEPYMYMAPRRLMLMPDQLQHVRFMVRRMENLPAGEYRSYIVFQPEVVPDQYNPETGRETVSSGTSVQMDMLSGFRIPVFFLNGETTLKTYVSEAGYGRDAKGKNGVYFTFVREGNRSAIGDLEVRCMQGDQIVKLTGVEVKIYTELNERNYFLPIKNIPPGCTTAYLEYSPHAADPDFTGNFVRLAEIPLQ